MPRLQPVTADTAPDASRPLLTAVKTKLGRVPNLLGTMAHSPATLQLYLSGSEILGKGRFTSAVREQIALTVGEANGCDYCVSAHSAIGKGAGLTDAQILAARRGNADDSKTEGLLVFARALVDKRGFADDDDVAAARAAGLEDGDLAEVVANVAFNVFTNWFNHMSDTQVDFPRVEALTEA